MDEVRGGLMHFPHIADGDYLNTRKKKKNDASFVHARRDHQFDLATGMHLYLLRPERTFCGR